jgi:hypothetical protein
MNEEKKPYLTPPSKAPCWTLVFVTAFCHWWLYPSFTKDWYSLVIATYCTFTNTSTTTCSTLEIFSQNIYVRIYLHKNRKEFFLQEVKKRKTSILTLLHDPVIHLGHSSKLHFSISIGFVRELHRPLIG